MRLIDRYICRQVFSHALLGLGIFTFVFFVPQLVRLMDLVVRHPASWSTIGILFLCTLPGILSFTLPIGVLVGVLIALGRLVGRQRTHRHERAGHGTPPTAGAGRNPRRRCHADHLLHDALARPSLGAHLSRPSKIDCAPDKLPSRSRLASSTSDFLTWFFTSMTSIPPATRWKGVFLAGTDSKDVSRLTLAEEAIVIADRREGKLELHLRNGSVHEFSAERSGPLFPFGICRSATCRSKLKSAEAPVFPSRHSRPHHDCPVANERNAARCQSRISAPSFLSLRVHFLCAAGHAPWRAPPSRRPRRRFSDHAALDLRLLPDVYDRRGSGAPGHDPRLAGYLVGERSYGRAWAVSAAAAGAHAGQQPIGRRVAWIAGWRIWKIFQREKPCRHSGSKWSVIRTKYFPRRKGRTGIPQLLDIYLLRSFFYYFVLLTVGFILLFEVFTFFELLDDIAQHRTGVLDVINYFIYLASYLFYQLAPLAALVAVLVTLGVMTKNNELVAFKAGGISLYRISLPLLLAGVCSRRRPRRAG